MAQIKQHPAFVIVSETGLPEFRKKKVLPATLIMIGVVAAAALNILPIASSALIGCVLLVLTKCLNMEETYRAIEWNVIFLLAGAITLGIAMEKKWSVTYQDNNIKKKKIGKWKTVEIWGTSEGSAKRAIPIKKMNPGEKQEDYERKFDGEPVRIGDEIGIQKLREGQYPTYNQFLKTKILGVLGSCMLKAKGEYTTFYYDYKQRKKDHFDKDLRLHFSAMRFMIKRFLSDFYEAWRKAEGLPVRCPYEEEYLDKRHHTN